MLVLPYAFTSSVTVVLMPYLLRKYGFTVDQIANIVVIANLPSIWSFLWSPLVDMRLRRRSWVMLATGGAALGACIAILGVHGSPAGVTALLFLMNAFAGLLSSACGALMTAMPAEMRGRSAGWYQGGNLGGSAIGGGLCIWLADHTSLAVLAIAITGLIMGPALAALLIGEPVRAGQAIGPHVANMLQDVKELLRSKRTWIGLVFLLSPVGSAAVQNLISGMGEDYKASGDVVLWVTGIGGGLLSAFGCYLGGLAADRIGRMFSYALAGGLAAVFALYLGFADATPFTYAVGYSCYAIAAGFAYAVFTAMVLDILGKREHAAASGYAVFNSAGNLPIEYMTWLDGVGYERGGLRGLMTVDAIANGGFGVILLILAIKLRRYWGQEDDLRLSQANGRNSAGFDRT